MKILMVLSKSFINDPRVTREAKTLVEAGHQVTVIFWDRKNEYKSQDVFEGIKLVGIHNSLLMKLLPGDLFRNPVWWRKAYRKGLELYKNDFHFDAVHCHDLDTLQSGVWLKKKLGCKLVYDAHEIFGYMIKNNVPNFAVKYSFNMEKKLLEQIDHLITVNEPLENYFKKITNKPITIVMNCKELIIKEYQPPKNSIFTICYMGVLNKARMFPELVDIIGSMKGVKFVIAGKKENLYDEVKEICKKYDNVEFLGTILSGDVIKKTLESNAIICMFDPSMEIHKIGLPNKIFEAMTTGRPVIVTKNMYYSDEFVEKEKCGLSASYESKDIVNAIIKLRDNPKLCEELGKNGLTAAKKKYNWEKQEDKLLNVYEEMK